MEAITHLLEEIYTSSLTQAQLDTIKSKISFAKSTQQQPRKLHWDEQDIVLITYADQFMAAEQPTLATLTTFFEQRLQATFNLVHLLPFYPYSSDDGFSVIDYHQVNPIVGSWQHISRLNQSTRLMFDFVCNHISAHSKWLAGYQEQQTGFENFFINVPPATDLSTVTRPRTSPLLTPFTMKNGETRYLWTTFSADQVDLNFADPHVLISIIGVLLHYLTQGADYIRLDAVGYLWKEIGTRCIHLPKTHLLVKLMRAIVDEVAPGTVIITETNVPHKDNISYFGNGRDEAQMVYQFPLPPLVLHAIHNGSSRALRQWAATLDTGNHNITYFNFLASHDGVGMNPLRGILPEVEINSLVRDLESEGALVSYKQNTDGTTSPYEINVTFLDALNRRRDTDDTRLGRFMLAHAILLAFPGVPAVYIQSILGSRNDYEGVKAAGYNRAVNREKYPLKAIEAALQDETSLRARVFHHLSDLIQRRRGQPAFHPDAAMEVLEWDNALFAFHRRSPRQNILCVFNLSAKTMACTLPAGRYRDVVSYRQWAGGTPLNLEPYQFFWLETVA
ncbi:alpha-amylase family glycosyl hydrolase [Acerihabitans arboris]|uniref:Sugar phosphorylase n=1 Tax=Acerihabitans arboris TaxID=2691583 RepID=A0A845SPE7_9GAMM|nr:alpha-amylase family glycosyl hydrolase [Acerihabitans arboris]NDL64461.1 sugar phosphorylase [Acerihabitans arboris]